MESEDETIRSAPVAYEEELLGGGVRDLPLFERTFWYRRMKGEKSWEFRLTTRSLLTVGQMEIVGAMRKLGLPTDDDRYSPSLTVDLADDKGRASPRVDSIWLAYSVGDDYIALSVFVDAFSERATLGLPDEVRTVDNVGATANRNTIGQIARSIANLIGEDVTVRALGPDAETGNATGPLVDFFEAPVHPSPS